MSETQKVLNQPMKVHQPTEEKDVTRLLENQMEADMDVKLLDLKAAENVPGNITEAPIKKRRWTRRGTQGHGRKINYKKDKR